MRVALAAITTGTISVRLSVTPANPRNADQ
jgi:hypothetical protein